MYSKKNTDVAQHARKPFHCCSLKKLKLDNIKIYYSMLWCVHSIDVYFYISLLCNVAITSHIEFIFTSILYLIILTVINFLQKITIIEINISNKKENCRYM